VVADRAAPCCGARCACAYDAAPAAPSCSDLLTLTVTASGHGNGTAAISHRCGSNQSRSLALQSSEELTAAAAPLLTLGDAAVV
jgi:hypothetical protein